MRRMGSRVEFNDIHVFVCTLIVAPMGHPEPEINSLHDWRTWAE